MTEAFHLLKNIVDVRHHVLAIHHDRFVGAVPQSHVEHGATLRIQKKYSRDFGSGVMGQTVNTASGWNLLNNEYLSEVDLLSREHLLPGSFNASRLSLKKTRNKPSQQQQ